MPVSWELTLLHSNCSWLWNVLQILTSHTCLQALVKSLLYYEIQFYCLTALISRKPCWETSTSARPHSYRLLLILLKFLKCLATTTFRTRKISRKLACTFVIFCNKKFKLLLRHCKQISLLDIHLVLSATWK